MENWNIVTEGEYDPLDDEFDSSDALDLQELGIY